MSKPHDYFPYVNRELCVDGIPLRQIAQQYGTPVYVYSGQAFADRVRDLQKGLAGLDHLICFAVKANSNLSVLSHLGSLGAGADLVSGGELQRALRAGIAPEKIVFSGVGKTRDEMELAISQGSRGVLSFNVESVPELATLQEVAQASGRRVSVALRYNPDVDPKTHPYISTGLKKNKFGLDKREILEIARNWSRYPALDCRGISIHIGSQLLSLKPLRDSFARVEQLVRELDRLLPRPLDWVDLGGGVGIGF
jgi:diaminopimelate decarboxylase